MRVALFTPYYLPTLEDVWGFVINEAMACGLPVISTYASQATIEIIANGENGFVVKRGGCRRIVCFSQNILSGMVR